MAVPWNDIHNFSLPKSGQKKLELFVSHYNGPAPKSLYSPPTQDVRFLPLSSGPEAWVSGPRARAWAGLRGATGRPRSPSPRGRPNWAAVKPSGAPFCFVVFFFLCIFIFKEKHVFCCEGLIHRSSMTQELVGVPVSPKVEVPSKNNLHFCGFNGKSSVLEKKFKTNDPTKWLWLSKPST